MKNKYDVAAYIWPSYTGDERRSRIFWPEGYGEWQTVHNAEANSYKKPANYKWNRKPLWGYVNEADPGVMEMEIECAAKYGVNVFIYDWYWYDRRPFLENCLNDGYLKAKNNDKVKFYLMWANHNAGHLWSVPLSDELKSDIIWRGDVDRAEFEVVVKRLISKYFSHPSYYKIDGKPVFMIYDAKVFVKGLGGAEGTRSALEYFRSEAKKAGFPDLYLQVASKGANYKIKCDDGSIVDPYSDLGFDGVTEYQTYILTHNDAKVPEDYEYNYLNCVAKQHYEDMREREGFCYFPSVAVGWDTNPRFINYDWRVAYNNTPENVETAFRQARDFIDKYRDELPAPLVVVNSWNEWTETSYLMPDNLNGYAYLEALKRVFIDEAADE